MAELETILVVEDNDSVLGLVVSILKSVILKSCKQMGAPTPFSLRKITSERSISS
jgi:hypothetical protein